MAADGTISLQLRAEGPGGAVGDALLVYPPSHPQYREILAHLGGLSPGESKPVPPWPDATPAGVEFAIAKDGVALGTVRIVAGQPATLELTARVLAAIDLKQHFDEAVAKGWFGVEVHETTPEGGRGALATRMYHPNDKDYALGVERWLRYEENLDVTPRR